MLVCLYHFWLKTFILAGAVNARCVCVDASVDNRPHLRGKPLGRYGSGAGVREEMAAFKNVFSDTGVLQTWFSNAGRFKCVFSDGGYQKRGFERGVFQKGGFQQ